MPKPPTRKKNSVKRPIAKRAKGTTAAEPPVVSVAETPPPPKYASFRLQKRIKRQDNGAPLPGSFRIMAQAIRMVWQHRRLFLGIMAIIGLLELVLVGGLAGRDAIGEARDTVSLEGLLGGISGSVTLFVYMLGLAGRGDDPTGGIYQFILVTIASLALIWALRQVYAARTVRIRDTFYMGMYPLIPFVLVAGVVVAQLLPLALGATIYSLVVSGGIAATGAEQLLWAPLFIALALVSLYMITSSVFALYIATLPEMTPLRALRSAQELVAARRFAVIRKVLFLPVALMVMVAAAVIPFILLFAPLAPWVLFAALLVALPLAHGYMYALYRELL